MLKSYHPAQQESPTDTDPQRLTVRDITSTYDASQLPPPIVSFRSSPVPMSTDSDSIHPFYTCLELPSSIGDLTDSDDEREYHDTTDGYIRASEQQKFNKEELELINAIEEAEQYFSSPQLDKIKEFLREKSLLNERYMVANVNKLADAYVFLLGSDEAILQNVLKKLKKVLQIPEESDRLARLGYRR